ncbi:hypothetical protein AKJ63_01740 [candidate division MSBL1 archaeon SCGC-AAA259D18]|uniref:Metallo-beta-lactamase domain-containing protein n=1 Tax=candidate division MSBL1 archaeon SCGC-AAA259D18 TaxID=1698262 RepID=A0A133UAL0_9EURY|nr:hypothetical protein AKJ63_01740 [candidate division MSBL1 archaeon SCGC-AAA259D18]
MKIYTISGYEKVGGNMTAVETNGKIVIFDMGADIERVVTQDARLEEMKTVEAIESRVVPNDSKIKRRRKDVVAIVVGHGHQDHCRAIPKLAGAYDCPIIATPYTADIIERFIENDREYVKNRVIRMEAGDTFQISNDFELEFVDMTHSIPHAVLSVLRTEEGTIVYSLDFKLDENPTLGKPVDYDGIKTLGEEGVKAYIADCTRSDESGKTKPEIDTKIKLRKILSESNDARNGIVITTFSSNIARLNNIIEANAGRRKIVLLGRSLKEYTEDAEENGLIDLSGVEVVSYQEKVESTLKEISKNKAGYLLVTTGNQGEPNAILSRIAEGEYSFSVGDRDLVIFSSVTIPTPINELNRENLKRKLVQRGADIEVDVHSHGHAKKEDQRNMIKMLGPEMVIPAHGGRGKLSSCAKIAREEGVDSVLVSRNNGEISPN